MTQQPGAVAAMMVGPLLFAVASSTAWAADPAALARTDPLAALGPHIGIHLKNLTRSSGPAGAVVWASTLVVHDRAAGRELATHEFRVSGCPPFVAGVDRRTASVAGKNYEWKAGGAAPVDMLAESVCAQAAHQAAPEK